MRVLAASLASHVGSSAVLCGWVHRVRSLKSVTFLIVRDRSGLAQVVLPPGVSHGLETVVSVSGVVVASEQAPGGAELSSASVTVLSSTEPPPFDLYRPSLSASLPTMLDHAAVAVRPPSLRTRFRVAAASVAGFRSALDSLGFTEIHTPKIVASATESGASVFGLDHFGRPAYLAQSPQFYKQTMVGVFERVYEVGPVFRAEPHDTARHLAQYTSLDAELGFITDHRDVMEVLREVLTSMVSSAAALVPAPSVPASIPSVHFAEALELVGASVDEPDLAPAHERALSEWALREHGSEFLFVTGYPMSKRPFYTHPSPSPAYSNSFDLLFRGLELVTGGQRLHRYADYLAVLGSSAGEYSGYLEAFRHGMPPHGGFALGLERWVARLLGLPNVRQATLFPRDLHRLVP
jgi:nondiscriminating aspartyl-tRNA synthetase